MDSNYIRGSSLIGRSTAFEAENLRSTRSPRIIYHGAHTYNYYGCRCDLCREAVKLARRKQRAKIKIEVEKIRQLRNSMTKIAQIQVTGPEIQVERFIVICKTIEQMCREGSTRTVSFDVDGDGPASLKFAFDPGWDSLEAVDTDLDPVRIPGINDY